MDKKPSGRPLRQPNLPDGRVTLAAVSERETALIEALLRRGLFVLPIPPAAALGQGSTASHPDMLLCPMGAGRILLDQSLCGLSSFLKEQTFNVQIASLKLESKYPNDCCLNCARVGEHAFCGGSAAPELIEFWEGEGLRIHRVRQGYCKCGLCVVSEEAVITADPGLAAAARHAGLEVLQIRPGFIELPGYAYGFLGGASGKLAPDLLAFCGEIESHPDYVEMRDFAAKHGVSLLSLGGGRLRDCGGILPLLCIEDRGAAVQPTTGRMLKPGRARLTGAAQSPQERRRLHYAVFKE